MRCLAIACLCAASAAFAQPLHQRIDQAIQAGHKDYRNLAAARTDDAEFLRRVSFDLAGRPPSAAETRAFLADNDPAKRTKLIDRLLSSPEYPRRMAEFFDVMLMDRRADSKVPRADWEEFLRKSFADNKPYSQLVRELLSTDGTDPKTRAAAKFFLERNLDVTIVTRDIGRLFLGQNLQCAQCHDHPLVDDYKQEHFYGIQAFFNRAFLFPNATDVKAVVAEKADGEVSFMSVFDKSKTQKSTAPRLPGLKPMAEPKQEKGKEYKVAPAKDVRPIPNYSRFAQLGTAITAADNVAFRRTAANRLWFLMFGRGLIHPLDGDHSSNPPSHPELLAILGDELASHQFDVKYILREMALSATYQLSSEPRPSARDLPADRFATSLVRPLSPEQFGYAVMQATGFIDAERIALGKNLTDAALQARLTPNLAAFRRMFGTRAGEPEEGFVATLDQTLFLKHGGSIRALIAPRANNLLERTMKLNNEAAMADELYLTVYSRLPSADERVEMASLLKPGPDRATVLTEVIWAMIASAEFRFNH